MPVGAVDPAPHERHGVHRASTVTFRACIARAGLHLARQHRPPGLDRHPHGGVGVLRSPAIAVRDELERAVVDAIGPAAAALAESS